VVTIKLFAKFAPIRRIGVFGGLNRDAIRWIDLNHYVVLMLEAIIVYSRGMGHEDRILEINELIRGFNSAWEGIQPPEAGPVSLGDEVVAAAEPGERQCHGGGEAEAVVRKCGEVRIAYQQPRQPHAEDAAEGHDVFVDHGAGDNAGD